MAVVGCGSEDGLGGAVGVAEVALAGEGGVGGAGGAADIAEVVVDLLFGDDDFFSLVERVRRPWSTSAAKGVVWSVLEVATWTGNFSEWEQRQEGCAG